jgi:hypothetical protein
MEKSPKFESYFFRAENEVCSGAFSIENQIRA